MNNNHGQSEGEGPPSVVIVIEGRSRRPRRRLWLLRYTVLFVSSGLHALLFDISRITPPLIRSVLVIISFALVFLAGYIWYGLRMQERGFLSIQRRSHVSTE